MPRPKCLNCGKPLRELKRSATRAATPADIAAARAEQDARNERMERLQEEVEDMATPLRARVLERESRKPRKAPLVWTQAGKQYVTESFPSGQYGQDGLGFFCKRACGEAFGVMAARFGYRRAPR